MRHLCISSSAVWNVDKCQYDILHPAPVTWKESVKDYNVLLQTIMKTCSPLHMNKTPQKYNNTVYVE